VSGPELTVREARSFLLRGTAALAFVLASSVALRPVEAAPVRVGSKAFTEGVLLGELAARSCASGGDEALHRRQLGGSVVLFAALEAGEIDVYPEYTGTLAAELLHTGDPSDRAAIARELARRGLAMSEPLGFENTYALGVPRALANERQLVRIGDLGRERDLVFGISHELVERADGWGGLRDRYTLVPGELRPMDHDVAYKAIASRRIDVMDLYTTDAEIAALDLVVLEDDRRYFPPYEAVLLHRAELEARAPRCLRAMRRLEGAIDASAMRAMNAAVKIGGASEDQVAADHLEQRLDTKSVVAPSSRASRIATRTVEHLVLSFASLFASAVVALPLGVLAARVAWLRSIVLGAAGIVQTIPSLALLVLMIPLLGIGTAPALAALLVYSLFPIVEGTVVGLTSLPVALRESAGALGLPRSAQLWSIELPLASPSIVSGLRTAAVLSVGTATIGAMVGAGGYGQPILTGVRLDSVPMILEGAIPAALLALAVQGLFRGVERLVVPRGVGRRGPR
jgi:osmoprotectant transport system permease protein